MSGPNGNEPEVEAATERIVAELREGDRFLITTHEGPDGDALGSSLALQEALTQLGKDSVMFIAEQEFPLPLEYRFLPLQEVFHEAPADLSVSTGGAARRLTRLNADLLQGKTLGQVQPLTVTSSYDQKPIDAWIVTPPNFDPSKKYPLILEIHGGPFSAYGPTFSTDDQLYAAAGYVVVYSNPRGSTSYGDAFANEAFAPRSDVPFYLSFGAIGGAYIVLIVLMLVAEGSYSSLAKLQEKLSDRNIQYSIRLSLISCTITTILSLWVAVPIGYLMSRRAFRGKAIIDAILDIPIVLPPLVIGLCLLILFQTPGGRAVESTFERVTESLFGRRIGITFEVPSVILAQFMVACAFAVRTMRVTFDQIHPRCEKVALTLGCNQSQAFWMVLFPQAHRGILAAATLAWERTLGWFERHLDDAA